MVWVSIVSRIAYWFGGEIKVDESPSLGGARFIMTWPAHRFKQPPLKTNKKHLHKVLFIASFITELHQVPK